MSPVRFLNLATGEIKLPSRQSRHRFTPSSVMCIKYWTATESRNTELEKKFQFLKQGDACHWLKWISNQKRLQDVHSFS